MSAGAAGVGTAAGAGRAGGRGSSRRSGCRDLTNHEILLFALVAAHIAGGNTRAYLFNVSAFQVADATGTGGEAKSQSEKELDLHFA